MHPFACRVGHPELGMSQEFSFIYLPSAQPAAQGGQPRPTRVVFTADLGSRYPDQWGYVRDIFLRGHCLETAAPNG